jgi:hypothetical protein
MNKITRKGALIDLLALPVAAAAVASVSTEAFAADDSAGTKKQYKYVTASKVKGAMCSNCALYVNPNKCNLVKGKISPKGWCTAYAKKG